MAVPKGKVSKARRDKRRSSHWKLETPGIVTCPKCGAYRLPHRMCKNCLTYNGRSFGQFEAQYACLKGPPAAAGGLHFFISRRFRKNPAGDTNPILTKRKGSQ